MRQEEKVRRDRQCDWHAVGRGCAVLGSSFFTSACSMNTTIPDPHPRWWTGTAPGAIRLESTQGAQELAWDEERFPAMPHERAIDGSLSAVRWCLVSDHISPAFSGVVG